MKEKKCGRRQLHCRTKLYGSREDLGPLAEQSVWRTIGSMRSIAQIEKNIRMQKSPLNGYRAARLRGPLPLPLVVYWTNSDKTHLSFLAYKCVY